MRCWRGCPSVSARSSCSTATGGGGPRSPSTSGSRRAASSGRSSGSWPRAGTSCCGCGPRLRVGRVAGRAAGVRAREPARDAPGAASSRELPAVRRALRAAGLLAREGRGAVSRPGCRRAGPSRRPRARAARRRRRALESQATRERRDRRGARAGRGRDGSRQAAGRRGLLPRRGPDAARGRAAGRRRGGARRLPGDRRRRHLLRRAGHRSDAARFSGAVATERDEPKPREKPSEGAQRAVATPTVTATPTPQPTAQATPSPQPTATPTVTPQPEATPDAAAGAAGRVRAREPRRSDAGHAGVVDAEQARARARGWARGVRRTMTGCPERRRRCARAHRLTRCVVAGVLVACWSLLVAPGAAVAGEYSVADLPGRPARLQHARVRRLRHPRHEDQARVRPGGSGPARPDHQQRRPPRARPARIGGDGDDQRACRDPVHELPLGRHGATARLPVRAAAVRRGARHRPGGDQERARQPALPATRARPDWPATARARSTSWAPRGSCSA